MARPRNQRERKLEAIRRKKAKRPPHDRVLIVCEGSKTEPNYFEEIRQQLRISSAAVRVIHSQLGTAPRQVVDFAEEQFLRSREFERVYAVFDRDEHESYSTAVGMANAKNERYRNDEGKAVPFSPIVSVPNFELWLLLHYEDIQAPIERAATIARLRTHIEGYEKGRQGVFELTKDRLPVAATRAQWLRAHFQPLPGEEPYTDVDALVAFLLRLRDDNAA